MKRVLTIVFFLILNIFLTSACANAQWVQQQTGVTEFLNDIEFIDLNTGWAVGDGGTVLKTTNGGENWISVPNPAGGKPILSVSTVNANIVYLAGWFETILKTTNGGQDWIEIRNGPGGTGDSYNGIYFVNENTGWIAGFGEKILRTTNGGQTIDSSYVFVGTFHDIYFANANTGLATMNGGVYKSTNGGINWFLSNLNNGGSQSQFKKISVVNNQYCWVIGNDDRIFKSTDFGSNWSFIDTLDGADQSRSIGFANAMTGWAGGIGLFKSTDGGFTWNAQNTGVFQAYYTSICFMNDTVGWTSSQFGKIFHTTDGGGGRVSISSYNQFNPASYQLYQNYPNPFNPATTIRYFVPKTGHINISVYDIRGRLARKLIDKIQAYENYAVDFNSEGFNSGIYFYRFAVNGEVMDTKKMILIK